MKHVVDPRQNWLLDSPGRHFSPLATKTLANGWPGVFRAAILELMPVCELEKEFSDEFGRPSKELYSICGLMLLMAQEDWTVEEAAHAYMFDMKVQYALNLGHDNQSLSTRTILRFRRLFRDHEIAETLMVDVTKALVAKLDLKIDQLRLDSTHVFSNMATMGRTKLLATVIRKFLVQLKRHDRPGYDALSDDLRQRYEKTAWEFSKGGRNAVTVEEIATDLHTLIVRFENDDTHSARSTYQNMVRAFSEQCQLAEGKVAIRRDSGGQTLQNPSDPDATYEPKKGPGYKVQAAETCSEENEVQLIVAALPQTGADHDQNSVTVIVDRLQEAGITPSTIVADTAYGGDSNHQFCAQKGIDLITPVNQGNAKPGRLDLADFIFNDSHEISRCPNGVTPVRAWYSTDTETGAAIFAAANCSICPLADSCRATAPKKHPNNYVYYDGRALRIAERKNQMKVPETAAAYRKRSGIEGTFSAGKRKQGMGRLRVRGAKSVNNEQWMNIAAINVFRAIGTAKLRELAMANIQNKAKTDSVSSFCPHTGRIPRFHGPEIESGEIAA